MTGFKDLFSTQAHDYSHFRPKYPNELFSYLTSLTKEKVLAWDVGTGNGQAAVELARHFDRVIATDPSQKQLAAAEKNSRVEYLESKAESCPLQNSSVNLITVAQAFHWFNHSEFFTEVKRVSKPEGILAIWCYELANFGSDIDRIVLHYYRDIIGKFWEPERNLVESGYRTISVPFKELIPPAFEMKTNWSLDHLIGYLGTWSATQKAISELNSNPLDQIRNDLTKAWGSAQMREAIWPLSLRVFKV